MGMRGVMEEVETIADIQEVDRVRMTRTIMGTKGKGTIMIKDTGMNFQKAIIIMIMKFMGYMTHLQHMVIIFILFELKHLISFLISYR